MVKVLTKKPVALDSLDHIKPAGTANDNSVNPAFNKKLFGLLSDQVRLLDIGCAGGGLVRSILNDGGFAIGIEGSDYSLKTGRAEWPAIPGSLFTADATEPFEIVDVWPEADPTRGEQLYFDCITAWEFFEHIAENKIAAVCDNIRHHLKSGGFFIGSIATVPHEDYHVTLHSKRWWVSRFRELGFTHRPSLEDYFGQDVVRNFGFTIAFDSYF